MQKNHYLVIGWWYHQRRYWGLYSEVWQVVVASYDFIRNICLNGLYFVWKWVCIWSVFITQWVCMDTWEPCIHFIIKNKITILSINILNLTIFSKKTSIQNLTLHCLQFYWNLEELINHCTLLNSGSTVLPRTNLIYAKNRTCGPASGHHI